MKRSMLSVLLAGLWPLLVQAQQEAVPTPQWRPVYHFTPPKNWTNDPNGLIYLDGVYHLYYQHNPYENKWGHMSWGHATSKDLLHWKHLPVAIPEIVTKDTTTWIFSGSAVLDQHNTSGFGKNGKAPLVAIYTADQPKQKKESQFIAYSNDGGLTYTNYPGNPVVDLNKKDFRDPSVIWLEDQQQWLMTVALPAAHKIQFYSSADLKEWKLLSEFGDQGDTRKIWECPSLTPIFVDGDTTRKKWLLMISSGNPDAATGMQYFVGDFDGKTFTNDHPPGHKMFVDYGRTFYAAIPYNNLPGNRQTMLGWLMPFETPTWPWRGQMSIARDLLLKSTPEGVRLFQQPSEVLYAVLEKLPAARKMQKENVTLRGELPLGGAKQFHNNAWWIEAELTPGTAETTGFKIARQMSGNKVVAETVVGYHSQRGELVIAQVKDGKGTGEPERVPVKPVNGKLKLQVLLDKSSLEVFVNGGEKVITTLIFPEKGATGLAAFAENGEAKLDRLKAWDLGK
ncbi:glycoside hydrolase family 32 protein [Chitinophaga japonensis]|uniref:Levanase/fructan beta-fructosidase n=1 Tax=Chitinophaga japonensis TaxID=104662 RepID=A0A562SI70_CHIJA|nr:glycoside hydrolase family 32 protein [Chitinophaga japonensis]TWI80952.1 levanase/fructan beta-fructosidase [Chitinophaga japonensis]